MLFILSSAGLDEIDQIFKIIKFIIITHDPFTVVDDAGLLVLIKAIEKRFYTIPFCKLSESTGFDLICIKSFTAVCRLTFITSGYILIYTASSHFTPFSVFAP